MAPVIAPDSGTSGSRFPFPQQIDPEGVKMQMKRFYFAATATTHPTYRLDDNRVQRPKFLIQEISSDSSCEELVLFGASRPKKIDE